MKKAVSPLSLLKKNLKKDLYDSILEKPKEWQLLAHQLEMLKNYSTSEGDPISFKAKKRSKSKKSNLN